MLGVIPSLPNTLSWRGAQFKEAQGQLYLILRPLKADNFSLLAL
jgi:hypothetical protein